MGEMVWLVVIYSEKNLLVISWKNCKAETLRRTVFTNRSNNLLKL